MSIDKATVATIARLAHIDVPEEDREHLAGELSHILTWVEQLNEVDTEAVPPMTSVVEMKLYRRPDEVTEGNQPDEILVNAPQTDDGFFVVPKVVE